MNHNGMNAQSWCDLLRFLEVIVMSGDRPYPQDLKAFKKAAPALKAKLGIPFLMDEELAKDRFMSKRQEVTRSLSSIHFEKTVTTLIDRLKVLPNKKAVAVALFKIAIEGDVERENELKIIKQAIIAWDMDMPVAKPSDDLEMRLAG